MGFFYTTFLDLIKLYTPVKYTSYIAYNDNFSSDNLTYSVSFESFRLLFIFSERVSQALILCVLLFTVP